MPTIEEASATIGMFYDSALFSISSILRGFIIPAPGHIFIGADFSSIEARALAWLAGEYAVLDIFRGHGKIYEHAAAGIYGVPISSVSKSQRQIGKVAVLALGYGGGKGAFQSMAKNYGVKVEDSAAEGIKVAWRKAHPHIASYWYDLENAAKCAIRNPGMKVSAGAEGRKVTYRMAGSFLWCQLPSARVICYPYPKLEEVDTPWGEKKEGITYMTEGAITRKWGKEKTYGGSLCENVCQAASRDVLAEAMTRLEAAGYPIVLTVHDEIVCEVPRGKGNVEEFEKIMCEIPEWADGFPIAAEGFMAERYQK